jgi:FkbM family methyltransferase
MPKASEFLARLVNGHRHSEIDWEALLEANYLALFSGNNDLGIIDIGGHAGRHSRTIQQRLRPKHLMIFEPLPAQRQMLREMFSRDLNVSVLGFALGNQRGHTKFVVKQGSPEESGLRRRSFYNDGSDRDLQYIDVDVETLDGLEISFQVDFIKIDTEGGEIDILRGATQLLGRDAPVISVEYGPGGYDAYGHKPGTLFELATGAGYGVFDLFGNRFGSMDEWLSCVARVYWDYLLIPESRQPSLADRLEIIRSLGEQAISSARKDAW